MTDDRYTLQPTPRAEWLLLLVPLIVVAFGYAWYFWGDLGHLAHLDLSPGRQVLRDWAVPYSVICAMVACFGLVFIVREAWKAFRYVASVK